MLYQLLDATNRDENFYYYDVHMLKNENLKYLKESCSAAAHWQEDREGQPEVGAFEEWKVRFFEAGR